MGDRVWHHRDKDGKVTEVIMNEETYQADRVIVGRFESMEGSIAGGAAADHPDHATDRQIIADLLPALHPLRQQHWRAELARVGIKLPAPTKKAVATKEEQVKVADDVKSEKTAK